MVQLIVQLKLLFSQSMDDEALEQQHTLLWRTWTISSRCHWSYSRAIVIWSEIAMQFLQLFLKQRHIYSVETSCPWFLTSLSSLHSIELCQLQSRSLQCQWCNFTLNRIIENLCRSPLLSSWCLLVNWFQWERRMFTK